MGRARVFWAMLRSDKFNDRHMTAILGKLELVRQHRLAPAPLRSYLLPNSSDIDAKRRKSKRGTMDAEVLRKCNDFRSQHGLPSWDAPSGTLFTDYAPRDVRESLTARELGVANIAWCWFAVFARRIPEDLVVDVSQSASRSPWKDDGTLPSPSTNSKFVIGTTLVDHQSMFRMMGWTPGTPELPGDLSNTQVTRLLGNMLCPPVIGGILAAVLPEVKFEDDIDFRRQDL